MSENNFDKKNQNFKTLIIMNGPLDFLKLKNVSGISRILRNKRTGV